MSETTSTPRIVSLLPSVTEILFALGAGKYVVGVTHECDHPSEVEGLARCTSSLLPENLSASEIDEAVSTSLTKDEHSIYRLNKDIIKKLNPTLIITQSLCAVCAVPETAVHKFVSECLNPGGDSCRIIASDPHNLDDELYESVMTISQAINLEKNGVNLVNKLKNRIQICKQISNESMNVTKPNVLFLEWSDPPFIAGHWVPQQIQFANGHCVLGNINQLSYRCKWTEILALQSEIDIIVCGFCGFDLYQNQHHIDVLKDNKDWLKVSSNKKIYATNANAFFSRPGNRLVDGVELLCYIFHNAKQYKPKERGLASKLLPNGWQDLSEI